MLQHDANGAFLNMNFFADTRIVRAHGLLELGKIFKEIADTGDPGSSCS